MTKFCMMTNIRPLELAYQLFKNQFLKIRDGGRLPFWKTLNAISLQPFNRFWWNLVWRCILALPTWWANKNLKIRKSKMADSCRFDKYMLAHIPMDRATLLHVKSTILHCPPSIITRQRASVDSKLLGRPRNVGYYHIWTIMLKLHLSICCLYVIQASLQQKRWQIEPMEFKP